MNLRQYKRRAYAGMAARVIVAGGNLRRHGWIVYLRHWTDKGRAMVRADGIVYLPRLHVERAFIAAREAARSITG